MEHAMMVPARAVVVLLASLDASSAAAGACDVTIEFKSVAVEAQSKNWLEQELQKAADKVCGWWGATYSGPLTIDVPSPGGPSMALVPAWRGQRGHMLFPAPAVRRRNSATVHEVVHVFAPNANRFLAEGLAVHAHDQLGGPPAYPNFGSALHTGARAYAQPGKIAALDREATPNPLQRDAYLVGGSFVRFLIERDGFARFRQLYAMTPLLPGQINAGSAGRWKQVYGIALDELSTAWQAQVGQAR
jgi:hypothetical protein